MLIAHYLIFGRAYPNFSSEAFIVLSNLCWAIISFLYKGHKIFQPLNLNDIIDKFLMTLIYQSLSVLGIIYFFKILYVSRGFVIISFGVFFLVIILQRIWLFTLLKSTSLNKHFKKRVVVLGNKSIADSLISAFPRYPEFGHESYEYLPESHYHDISETVNLEELLTKNPDEIFVCYKEMNIRSLDRLILFGEKNYVKIKVVFDLLLNNKRDKLNYNSLPILHLNSRREISIKIKFLKRSFDVLFTLIIMGIGAPIFAAVYLITKLTSKGKAFYKQERIGKDEKPFYIYKFRSMYADAEKLGPQLSKNDDPRVTKWGMFMRKTKLDELPQFWNVMKGDMSIVGYRPERKHYIEEITKKSPEYKRLLRHKPGITSLGQVHYGYAENVDQMRERLKYDLLYLRNINLNSDMNIILKTVRVMVQAKGR
jgi:exopolysaccharide biosynthesis polyprenyl glycosylphosphotransferase